ncbi:Bug family tripartite tricarboxylate transporter substrate binding protein [Chelatococcus sp. GCM10030263]|uniref:Bug family tripartite tricarboxylate transporter substrate binding protein n=1 Tax=Chelatococcus sp. GCM10030263 TaxID=3273387 RepID=UPI0036086615
MALVRMRRAFLQAVVGVLFTAGSGFAAQAFPDRPITVIVPYPAGGGTDIVARTLVNEMQKELGVAINVVNRGGGGGIVGTTAIASAKPEGYTIGLVASDISIYKPQGLSDLTFADVTAIGEVDELPGGITVSATSSYQKLSDLIDAIKAHPNTLKGTGAAPGTNWNIGFSGFMLAAGLDPKTVIWVPTQGGTAGHLDVAAGNSTFSTASLAEARALIEAKKLRPLAVMADERTKIFPDVPTLKELGINWSFGLWHGVVGPKNLPPEEFKILSAAVKKAANTPAFRTAIEERGFRAVWRGGDDFTEFMKADLATMQELFNGLKK